MTQRQANTTCAIPAFLRDQPCPKNVIGPLIYLTCRSVLRVNPPQSRVPLLPAKTVTNRRFYRLGQKDAALYDLARNCEKQPPRESTTTTSACIHVCSSLRRMNGKDPECSCFLPPGKAQAEKPLPLAIPHCQKLQESSTTTSK
jgi:hypothetical protein